MDIRYEYSKVDYAMSTLRASTGHTVPLVQEAVEDPVKGAFLWFQPHESACPDHVRWIYTSPAKIMPDFTSTFVGGFSLKEDVEKNILSGYELGKARSSTELNLKMWS